MSDPMPPSRPPARREPVFNLPIVVVVCCAVLLAIYALYSFASDATQDWVVTTFAFVPARLAIALGVAQGKVQAALQNLPLEVQTQVLGSGGARWWTLVTYAFLHGSWAHVGFNCLWLAVFGAPVARRFAAPRFLVLLLLAAVVGALVQFLAAMASFVPVVGASAAIAGAMGAAVRFVFRPANEADALFHHSQLDAAFRRRALTLVETFTTKAAVLFIAFWFVTNLVFGLYPSLSGVTDGPIAWPAHLGGFLTGLLVFPLLDPRRPAPAQEPGHEDSADLPMSSEGMSSDGTSNDGMSGDGSRGEKEPPPSSF